MLTCPCCIPGHSLCTICTSQPLSHSDKNCSRFCRVPSENKQSDTFIISTHPAVPSLNCSIRSGLSQQTVQRDRDRAGARRNKRFHTRLLLSAENTVTSENRHGSSAQKCFNGYGKTGAPEHRAWQRWARAALVVKKVGGMPPEAL